MSCLKRKKAITIKYEDESSFAAYDSALDRKWKDYWKLAIKSDIRILPARQ